MLEEVERDVRRSAGAIHHAQIISQANLSAGMIKHNCLPAPPPRPARMPLNTAGSGKSCRCE